MPPPPANMNAAWASLLISLLERSGITQVVASPGSRSTPLTVAAARNEAITTTMHFDERGAAFFALGLARATGQPAALICTSGSAVANYFPAVVEASMDNVPLLLLTSDRPPELQGKGANQTIPQQEIYGQFARRAIEVDCPAIAEGPEEGLKKVAAALEIFRHQRPGPVQINCPFREPLAPDENGDNCDTYILHGQQWLGNHASRTLGERPEHRFAKDSERILVQLSSVSRGVIVVGKLGRPELRESIHRLAEQTGWPIIADIQSGMRIGSSHPSVIGCADQLFVSASMRTALRPDGVLHIGGRVTSKRILEWLKRSAPEKYVRIDNTDQPFDPNDQMDHAVIGDLEAALTYALDNLKPSTPAGWLNSWQQAGESIREMFDELPILEQPPTELSVCREVARYLASVRFDQSNRPSLWAASSLPIRMFDMYADSAGTPVDVQSNRGASGIDGTIASAAGYAAGSQKPLVLVIGDLAFLHDLNSLDLVRRSAVPITIVLLNNDGGNIFSLLPIAKHTDVFEQYFRTPHGLTFKHAAQQFGLPYTQTDSLEILRETFAQSLATGKSSLIEVTIDNTAGPAQMRNIADMIRSRFDGA